MENKRQTTKITCQQRFAKITVWRCACFGFLYGLLAWLNLTFEWVSGVSYTRWNNMLYLHMRGEGQVKIMANQSANSEDADQMLHFVASDLGLHCLPVSSRGGGGMHQFLGPGGIPIPGSGSKAPPCCSASGFRVDFCGYFLRPWGRPPPQSPAWGAGRMNAPINIARGYTHAGNRVECAPCCSASGFRVRLPCLRPLGAAPTLAGLGVHLFKEVVTAGISLQATCPRVATYANGWLSSTELCGKSCLAGFCRVHLMRLRKGSLTRPCWGCGVGAYNKQGLCRRCGYHTAWCGADRAMRKEFAHLAAVEIPF